MRLTIIQSIRTNNFADDLVMKKIAGMWKEASGFLTNHEGITYGVYHEYESDYRGDYTLSIAIEANNKAPIIEIPDGERFEIYIQSILPMNKEFLTLGKRYGPVKRKVY